MNRVREQSAPSLVPGSSDESEEHDYPNLEDVTATVELLMRQIQNHQNICCNDQNGMMTILEDLKTQIFETRVFENTKKESKTRCCQTELKLSRDKKPNDPMYEIEKLRRAQKSLEAICSSLGKEKEIMASELVKKAREISGTEELLSDLKTQNETLSSKIKQLVAENKGKSQCHVALQERNKALSEKLLRTLEGYKSMKRKLKEADEDNRAMRGAMEEMNGEIGTSLERIRGFKQSVTIGGESTVEIEEKIAELENMFECFQTKVSKHGKKIGECVKPKGEISACSPVLA